MSMNNMKYEIYILLGIFLVFEDNIEVDGRSSTIPPVLLFFRIMGKTWMNIFAFYEVYWPTFCVEIFFVIGVFKRSH